ncbi:hypothetical protein F5B22DRAFT_643438 [Xylaria bambusicola]|uniref:uncharacterized protein n=1 Tax=Xylaria bambusicola TaxID=326684 RepID=UPI00200817B4|nr:uncharacterized protein F5B22DRAFT_643438 [Xylaria bambusicola]KAI0521853.1 hypothetical protein F5B22DRAFT_643438 [Xylaria bambusicola]
MSSNGFLSPRDLLINNKFCCDGPNFTELTNALWAAQDLPASEMMINYKTGLSENGIQALYSIVWPIVERFQEIQQSSANLRIGCQKVKDVCDRALYIASTAQPDYDAIFDDLEKLFMDPDNDSLRQQVDKTIGDRLTAIDALKAISGDATNLLRSSTTEIIEIQSKLTDLGNALGGSDIHDKLASRDPTEEDVQNDLAAVSILRTSFKDIIKGQNMQDQSGPSLNNLEILLGAVSAITGDLDGLRDSIKSSTQPGPGLLLNVEKAKVLELWATLQSEVQKFKDQYSV